MVTVTFNTMAIPMLISAICVVWSAIWMIGRGDSTEAWIGRPLVWLIGVGVPSFPALIAWLIWALLT